MWIALTGKLTLKSFYRKYNFYKILNQMKNLFILYYHKILPKRGFEPSYKIFDFELRYLKQFYDVVGLDEVHAYLKGEWKPKRNSVVITFDDGYLDNFVYAYPLLKKHKLKATVFTIASRILNLPDAKPRPSLTDYWNNKVSFNELHKPLNMGQANIEYFTKGYSNDYMNSVELNSIKDHFAIEGHLEVHARSFYEDKIKSVWELGKNSHYSDYHRFREAPIKGFPIFPDRNNISVREGILKYEVKDFVKQLPKTFFEKDGWQQILIHELETQFPQRLDFETKEEQIRRVDSEMKRSKADLENLINQKVNYLSYPFGDYDDVSVATAKKYFKLAVTTEKDIVRPDCDMHKVPRGAVAKDPFSFLGRVEKFRMKS